MDAREASTRLPPAAARQCIELAPTGTSGDSSASDPATTAGSCHAGHSTGSWAGLGRPFPEIGGCRPPLREGAEIGGADPLVGRGPAILTEIGGADPPLVGRGPAILTEIGGCRPPSSGGAPKSSSPRSGVSVDARRPYARGRCGPDAHDSRGSKLGRAKRPPHRPRPIYCSKATGVRSPSSRAASSHDRRCAAERHLQESLIMHDPKGRMR
jgi:hypothetical protein